MSDGSQSLAHVQVKHAVYYNLRWNHKERRSGDPREPVGKRTGRAHEDGAGLRDPSGAATQQCVRVTIHASTERGAFRDHAEVDACFVWAKTSAWRYRLPVPWRAAQVRLLVLLLSTTLASGVLHDVSAQTAEVTATCRDGTTWSGTSRRGACSGHQGVQAFSSQAPVPGAVPSAPAPAARTSTPPSATTPATTASPAAPVGPRHAATDRWSWCGRCRPGLGQHGQQGLPLPWNPLLREDQSRQLHDRSRG